MAVGEREADFCCPRTVCRTLHQASSNNTLERVWPKARNSNMGWGKKGMWHREIFYFPSKCMAWKKWRKKKDANSTPCSQAVTHPSTNRALRCFTSVIGRELVRSTWYGRWRKQALISYYKRLDGTTMHQWYCKNIAIDKRGKPNLSRDYVAKCQQHPVFPGGHPSKY